jgi:hypothetical protein
MQSARWEGDLPSKPGNNVGITPRCLFAAVRLRSREDGVLSLCRHLRRRPSLPHATTRWHGTTSRKYNYPAHKSCFYAWQAKLCIGYRARKPRSIGLQNITAIIGGFLGTGAISLNRKNATAGAKESCTNTFLFPPMALICR